MSSYRDPEHIEQDIENTREQLGDTLDALQEKFSPGRLLDQAIGSFKNSSGEASDIGAELADAVKRNPLPAALVGLGLGWLMLSERGSKNTARRDGHDARHVEIHYGQDPLYRAPPADPRAPHDDTASPDQDDNGQQSAARAINDKATAAAERIKSTATDVSKKASAAASAVGDTMADWSDQVKDSADHYGQRTREGLLLGAGLAIGAALGAGLPSTRREDKLMGEARDGLLDQAKVAGAEQMDKVKAVAAAAADAATESAKNENIDGDSGKQAVRKAANKARKVAKDAGEAAKKASQQAASS